MSRVVELLRSRRGPQVAALALMSFGLAGCSADTQSGFPKARSPIRLAPGGHRLGADPAGRAPRTAAICAAADAVRRNTVAAVPPPIRAAILSGRQHAGVSGGGRGLASYAPPPHPQLETTGTVAPKSVAAPRASLPRKAGTTIIVGTSDTLDILASRYNVSPAAILQANGYKGPRALSPGQQLIIPRPTTAAAAPAPAVAAPASKPVAARADRSYRQSRRHAEQHRAPQPCAGRRTREGQQSRSVGQTQPRHEDHRAGREERCAPCPAVAAPRSRSPR